MIQFWLQFTHFPASVIQRINSLCANFVWNSKAHKISWDDVCKTKDEGGLGIRKTEEIAKIVVIKLIWDFIQAISTQLFGCIMNTVVNQIFGQLH